MNNCKWIVCDNDGGVEIITDNYEEALEVYEKCKAYQEEVIAEEGEFTLEERVILAEIKKDFYPCSYEDEGKEFYHFEERNL